MNDLVSPRTRARIVREITQGGSVQATRRGIKMLFSISDQPTFEGERVEWRARIRRHWYSGKAGSVFDAIRQIERQADAP